MAVPRTKMPKHVVRPLASQQQPDSSYTQRQVENDRMTGYGIIQPGAGANRSTGVPTAGEALRGIGSAVKRVLYPQVRPATSAEDEAAKLKGERAYYEGKIARQRKQK